jgi:8-oxo-dGTP pyrophosphatase MutT (NUDIX family)
MTRRRISSSEGEHSSPASSVTALLVFTDIRGFTRWSEKIEVFSHLDRFVSDFLVIIEKHFSDFTIKGLGDGAMIVRPIKPVEVDPRELLAGVIARITRVDHDFAGLCREFAESIGHQTALQLGWGVVRGEVKSLKTDFVGSNVNKCARLCDAARPFGIVVDADDFPDSSIPGAPRFYEQTRKLSGLEEVRVWVTSEIESQFVTRENLKQTPEVHVAGMCIDNSNKRGLKLLLATRSKSRRIFPGKIEGCGGQLKYSESFSEGVERHFRLEMGIEVKVLPEMHCFYEIKEPNEPLIPGIRFLCERVGDAEPSSNNHDKLEWVSESQFRNMSADRFVGNLKDEVIRLLDRYKSRR